MSNLLAYLFSSQCLDTMHFSSSKVLDMSVSSTFSDTMHTECSCIGGQNPGVIEYTEMSVFTVAMFLSCEYETWDKQIFV